MYFAFLLNFLLHICVNLVSQKIVFHGPMYVCRSSVQAQVFHCPIVCRSSVQTQVFQGTMIVCRPCVQALVFHDSMVVCRSSVQTLVFHGPIIVSLVSRHWYFTIYSFFSLLVIQCLVSVQIVRWGGGWWWWLEVTAYV